MKKSFLIISIVMVLLTSSFSFAIESGNIDDSARPVETTEATKVEEEFKKSDTVQVEKKQEEQQVTPAAQKILNNSSKKDKKIAEYKQKYNDETFAHVAYWLDVIQLYSIPICIIGITIGAFNFYIIGEKKLDKREKGFSYIMAFLSGLVFFQVLPLIFALLVAGK